MEQIQYQELSSSKINSQFITIINRNKNLALNVWKKKKKDLFKNMKILIIKKWKIVIASDNSSKPRYA